MLFDKHVNAFIVFAVIQDDYVIFTVFFKDKDLINCDDHVMFSVSFSLIVPFDTPFCVSWILPPNRSISFSSFALA